MKILIIHNRYKDRTGEDAVFDSETQLLKDRNHEVHIWTVDNRDIKSSSILEKIAIAKATVWSSKAYRQAFEKLRELAPDIVHVHNTLPLLSPAIFHACNKARIPVVHTLHNYRLVCPSNTLFRDGKICEKCTTGTLLNSVRHACYRNSYVQTAAVATMLQYHRWVGTWRSRIDGYIALSEFQKLKLKCLNIPDGKIYLKPNFLEKFHSQTDTFKFGLYYLFVGRLIDEKGIELLLESYQNTNTKYPLVIIGPGHLSSMVDSAAKKDPRIRYIGSQSKVEVLDWMKNAIALLFPSVWSECSPMTVLESLSCSLPVVCSDLGALPDMIRHQKTGYICSPITVKSLTNAIHWIESNSQAWLSLKKNLAESISPVYFRDFNYIHLIKIYSSVIEKYNGHGISDVTSRKTRTAAPN